MGKAVYFQFHEIKQILSPPTSELTNNLLFEFAVLEKDYKEFEEYLFPTSRSVKIEAALIAMEQYLGNDYVYGGGASRTSLDEEGTSEMDCSEFMSRYLQQLGLFETVPVILTSTISDPEEFQNTSYGKKLQFIGGGKNDPGFIPEPGDVFVWSRSTTDGHTGVVVEYDAEKDHVIIIEAVGKYGKLGCTAELNSLNADRGCEKVVKSTYTRIGNALYSHEGWIGYYRPVIE